MTNYERIKYMSVEEMANLFEEISICCLVQDCNSCPIHEPLSYCTEEYIKIWLESEVEEE